MKKRMFFTILGLVILFGGVFGYKWFVAYKTQQYFAHQEAPTQTVTATEASTDTWQPVISAVGSLSAVKGVDVKAEVSGKVVGVNVDDGAKVARGRVLVHLDSDAARADLRGMQAQARLDQIELKRQERLRKQKVNSQADVDTAQSKLEQARAQVDAQQALLDKKTIDAPFAGRIGIVQVDEGQFIDAGTPIVTLQTLDPINVDFTVPQQDLARLKVGQGVVASVDAFGDEKFSGKVTAISPKVNQATRNVSVRGRMSNAAGKLRPGMFVDVAVQLPQKRNVITLPQTAVTYNPYGNSVYVIHEKKADDGKSELTVERKFVNTGETRGDQVEITSGIKPGTRVVTSGQLKLRNGSKVKIDNSVTPSDSPSPQLGNH